MSRIVMHSSIMDPSLYGWEPSTWTRPGYANRYLFLRSLEDHDSYLYEAAEALYAFSDRNVNYDPQYFFRGIKNFLNKAILSEREKEIGFIEMMEKKYDEAGIENFFSRKYSGDELLEDPGLLMKAMNEAMLGAKGMQTAIKEIMHNVDIRGKQMEREEDESGKKYRGGRSYTQALQGTLSAVVNILRDKGTGPQSDVYEAVMGIIMDHGGDMLSGEAFAQMTTEISAAIKREIEYNVESNSTSYDEIFWEKTNNDPGFMRFRDQLNTLEKRNKDFANEMDKFYSKRFKYLTGNKDNDNSGVPKKLKDMKQNSATRSLLSKTGIFNTKERRRTFKKFAKGLVNVDIKTVHGRGGELQTGIEKLLTEVVNMNTGGSGTVTDQIKLFIDLSLNQGQVNAIQGKFEAMIEESAKVNHEEYVKQNQNFRELYQELSKELNTYSSLDGMDSYLVQENIKDYATLAIDWKRFEGFEGSAGWKVEHFISFLSSLPNLGFKLQDVDRLSTALINTADSAVGYDSRPALQKYLETFAVMVLFSDGATIVDDMARDVTSKTSVKALHVFRTNNIYFTASQLLERVYEGILQFQNNESNSSSVDVTINPSTTNYESYLKGLNKEKVWATKRWEDVRADAVKRTIIKIRFLANFFDVLEECGIISDT